jgi:hypothetical protein
LTSTESTTVVQTVACDLGRHQSCRKVVLSLTDAHGSPCACTCHGKEAGQGIAAGLPAAFAELVFTFPPCDEDVDLTPIDDDELDELLELEGDRLLELDAESRLFGAEL